MSAPIISSNPSLNPTKFSVPSSNSFSKSWVTDRHRQPLTKEQIGRRDYVLNNSEEIVLIPNHESPDVSFTLKEVLDYLFPRIRNMIDEPICIIGGAASYIMGELEYADVDICCYIRKDYFSEIINVVRNFIRYKIEIAFNDIEIDKYYLYRKILVPGTCSFFGLGKVDLKFILDRNSKRSITSSDGFHIPLFANSSHAYCVNHISWCDAQHFQTALSNLITRQFVIENNNKEDIEDLPFRVSHKMSQGFRIDAIEDLSSLALEKLVKTFPLKTPHLQEKFKRHQENHYSDCEIELTIDTLNFMTFLLLCKNNQKARESYFQSICQLRRKNNPLFSLMAKNPERIEDFLALVKGLYLIEWAKHPKKYHAYNFSFSENPKTPRYCISIPCKKDVRYLSINGNPIEIVKHFLLAWRRLEGLYENNKDFLELTRQLGIKYFPLSKEARIDTIRFLCNAFHKSPITTVMGLYFKSSCRSYEFYEFLIQERFEGISSVYLKKQMVTGKLNRALTEYPSNDSKIQDFINALIKNLDHERSLTPQELIALLETLKGYFHPDFSDQFLLNPMLVRALNDLFIHIVLPTSKQTNPNAKILRLIQDLTLAAIELNLFRKEVVDQILLSISQESTNDFLTQNPEYLIATHHFVRKIRTHTDFKLKIEKCALAIVQNIHKDNEELMANCLQIAFQHPKDPVHSKELAVASRKFLQYAISSKNGFTLRCAYEFVCVLLKHQIPFSDHDLLLQIAEQLIGLTKEQFEPDFNVSYYRKLGFDLLESLSHICDATVNSKIRARLLKCAATSLVTQREKYFHESLSTFLKLKGVQENLPTVYQKMEQLYRMEFEESNILREFVYILFSLDTQLAIKVVAHPSLAKAPFDRDIYVSLVSNVLNLTFSTSLVNELSQLYDAWTYAKSSLVRSDRMRGSINLLQSLLNAKTLDMKKCNALVDDLIFTLQSLEVAIPEVTIGKKLHDLIELLISKNCSDLAERLQSTSSSSGIFTVDLSNKTFLQITQHRFIADDRNEELLQNVLKDLLEKPRKDKAEIIALASNLIRRCMLTPKVSYHVPLEAAIQLLKLTKLEFSLLLDLINQIPNREVLGNEYNTHFTQVVSVLNFDQLTVENKKRFLFATAQLEKIWRSPEVWGALQTLTLNEEEKEFFHFEIVKTASNVSKNHFLDWLKKNILPNKKANEKIRILPHLFKHVELISKDHKEQIIPLAEFLDITWSEVTKPLSYLDPSGFKPSFEIYIKVAILTKSVDWYKKACSLITEHPHLSSLPGILNLFSHITTDVAKADLKKITYEMANIALSVLPSHFSQKYDSSLDKNIIKLIRALHGKEPTPMRYVASCIFDTYLSLQKPEQDQQQIIELIFEMLKSALFTGQYMTVDKLEKAARKFNEKLWNENIKSFGKKLLDENQKALTKLPPNDIERGQNFIGRTGIILKLFGQSQPALAISHTQNVFKEFTEVRYSSVFSVLWHDNLLILGKCLDEIGTPSTKQKLTFTNLLIKSLRHSYSNESLDKTLVYIDTLLGNMNFSQQPFLEILLEALLFAHDQFLIALSLDKTKLDYFKKFLAKLEQLFNQEMPKENVALTLAFAARIIRRLTFYQYSIREVLQAVNAYGLETQQEKQGLIHLYKKMIRDESLKQKLADCFSNTFRDFVMQEPASSTIFDIIYHFQTDEEFMLASNAGIGTLSHDCLLDFVKVLLGTKIIHHETSQNERPVLSSLLRLKGFLCTHYRPEFVKPIIEKLEVLLKEKSPLLANALVTSEKNFTKSFHNGMKMLSKLNQ